MHLGTLFLEGPQGLVPSTFGIISPALQSPVELSFIIVAEFRVKTKLWG